MPVSISIRRTIMTSFAGLLVAGFCAALPAAAQQIQETALAAETGSVSSRLAIPGEAEWSARAAVRGRAVVRGPRGGVAAGRRGAVVRSGGRARVTAPARRPAVVRPRRPVVVAPGWRRPASYWWRPGGAIAAGAAIGFVSAAAAAAYAGSPPASGYCWYYTNPQRTQGFWDICP
jgi:hypothetical protein